MTCELETVEVVIPKCRKCGDTHRSVFLRPVLTAGQDSRDMPNLMQLNRIETLPCGFQVFHPKKKSPENSAQNL